MDTVSLRSIRTGIKEPVPSQNLLVGIIVAEKRIGHNGLPNRPFRLLPVLNSFGTLDDYLFSFSRFIGDTADIAVAGMGGLHPFPVNALMDDDSVAGFRYGRRSGDCPKRIFPASLSTVASVYRYMIFYVHCFLHSAAPRQFLC